MIIKDLPIGTKLMWDAPEPYNGYSSYTKTTILGRICYPAIVVNREELIIELGTKIRTGEKSNWMGDENEFLRLPTEEELTTLTWPNINIKKIS